MAVVMSVARFQLRPVWSHPHSSIKFIDTAVRGKSVKDRKPVVGTYKDLK